MVAQRHAWAAIPLVLGLLAGGSCRDADPEQGDVREGKLLHTDSFKNGLGQWVVEQQPGGTVTAIEGRLVIDDQAGCTVWFRTKLREPVIISYTATVGDTPRTSDLNCFWMATDPARPDDLFASGHARDGRFATYDSLRTYYVGYGGNTNTSTRFRRYPGDGTRPMLPEHDLTSGEVLLEAGRPYRIQLVAMGNRIQYLRDGEVIFDFADAEPLREGWFGFRTVQSRIEFTDFAIHEAVNSGDRSSN